MKRQNLVCALLYLQLFAAVPGGAESPQKVTVSMRPYKGPRSVVAVKVNGAGPYDFMVDTGATIIVAMTSPGVRHGRCPAGRDSIEPKSCSSSSMASTIG
jgi:hypothetical protein